MKSMLLPAALSAMVAIGGCIPSSQLAEGELDRYWLLSEDPTPRARYHQPSIGDRKFPAHWVIRQGSDVAAATESMRRASDRMKQGVEKIDFSVSVEHAEMLVGLIDQIRDMLGNLARLVDADADSDRKEWTRLMASTLVQVEYVTRSVEGAEQARDGNAESPGTSIWPLLKMLTLYLHENSGGALLADMAPAEVDRMRAVLTQVALRLGFDLTGKQLPPDLRREATDLMRRTRRLDEMERALAEMLAERVAHAPVAPQEAQTRKLARVASSWAPKALEVMRAFMKQWDRMDRIELELRRDGDRPVMVGMVKVLPGNQVRIADVMVLQPTMVFRGTSRIVLIPEVPGTGERVLIYQPTGDGGVELRFEGMIYGLVRLLAIPLADGHLREIRVFTRTPKWGHQIVNVAVFTEAIGDKGDPRRLLVFQDVRRKRMVREAFVVRGVKDKENQVFNYLTPRRRYTFHRSGQLADR